MVSDVWRQDDACISSSALFAKLHTTFTEDSSINIF
jgi:hypothetical protein